MRKFPANPVLIVAGVLVAGLCLGLAAGFKTGINKPVQSDALYFLDVARSLAAGEGYRSSLEFWSDTPSMRRLPGWPAAVAAALKLVPGGSDDAVMRTLALVCHALAAAAMAGVAWVLFRRAVPAWIAGLGAAIHPTGLYAALEGLSEPLFMVLATAGVLLIVTRKPRLALAGALLLGLSCLVRIQFVLFGGAFVAISLLWCALRRAAPAGRTVALASAGFALFVLPTGLWTVRNAVISGHFPVLSTLGGQTFYGGNNPVVAGNLDYWGYWVFPNEIPGETPMAELAGSMSEYEVDAYYNKKGMTYVLGNLPAMPRLWLGKLVRAYVPIPWKPVLGSYVVSLYRWILLAGFVVGLVMARRSVPALYMLLFISMLATGAVSVVLYWGCARFAYVVEPFMLIPASVLFLTHRNEGSARELRWDGVGRTGMEPGLYLAEALRPDA